MICFIILPFIYSFYIVNPDQLKEWVVFNFIVLIAYGCYSHIFFRLIGPEIIYKEFMKYMARYK